MKEEEKLKEKEAEKEEDKETITNKTFGTEKNGNDQEQKTASTEKKIDCNKIKDFSQFKSVNSTKLRFCDFLVYKITCGKNKDKKIFELYENFRKKIISVENLMQNYLKINNLLKLEKRRSRRTLKNQ